MVYGKEIFKWGIYTFVSIFLVLLTTKTLFAYLPSTTYISLVKGGTTAIILIFIGMLMFWHRRVTLKSTTKTSINFLFPLIIALLFHFGIHLSTGNYKAMTNAFLWLSIITTFFRALAEEIVIRWGLLNIYLQKTESKKKAVIYSSIIFSIAHIFPFFENLDLVSLVVQLLFAYILGCLLGSLYILTSSLAVVTFIHFLINLPPAVKGRYVLDSATGVENINSIEKESTLSLIVGILLLLIFYSPLFYSALHYFRKLSYSDKKKL